MLSTEQRQSIRRAIDQAKRKQLGLDNRKSPERSELTARCYAVDHARIAVEAKRDEQPSETWQACGFWYSCVDSDSIRKRIEGRREQRQEAAERVVASMQGEYLLWCALTGQTPARDAEIAARAERARLEANYARNRERSEWVARCAKLIEEGVRLHGIDVVRPRTRRPFVQPIGAAVVKLAWQPPVLVMAADVATGELYESGVTADVFALKLAHRTNAGSWTASSGQVHPLA